MAPGALLIAGFAALAVVVVLTFVEWRSALDGLSSVGIVSAPPILAGGALLALGRWVYGGWQTDTPIARAASVVLPVLGVIGAFVAIGMFFMALFAETGRGGVWVVGQFAISVVASFALIVCGVMLGRKQARV